VARTTRRHAQNELNVIARLSRGLRPSPMTRCHVAGTGSSDHAGKSARKKRKAPRPRGTLLRRSGLPVRLNQTDNVSRYSYARRRSVLHRSAGAHGVVRHRRPAVCRLPSPRPSGSAPRSPARGREFLDALSPPQQPARLLRVARLSARYPVRPGLAGRRLRRHTQRDRTHVTFPVIVPM